MRAAVASCAKDLQVTDMDEFSAPQHRIAVVSTMEAVSAQPVGYPADDGQHDVIHLGGETAVVVPVAEYRRLRALERWASAEELERTEAEAVAEAHREWVGAGRPGAVPHDQVRALLLGERQ